MSLTTRLALGALLLAFGIITPVNAGDLGGPSGVADLEERIAEIESTVVRRGNRRVTLQISGQVSKAILWVNDGSESRSEVMDNHISGTRLNFMGEAKISPALSAGYVLQVGLNDQPVVPVADDHITIRHSYWWVQGAAGKVSMGLTSMASDMAASTTLANTDVASRLMSIQPLSNAFLLGADLPFNDLRRNVVRYDSPNMGGFTASASWGRGDTPFGFGTSEDQAWDIALRYAGEFGDFRTAAAVAYSKQDGNIGLTPLISAGRDTVLSGSLSVMHMPSGLFVSAGAGDVKGDDLLGDFRMGHMQAGIEKKLNTLGATTFYGEYARMQVDGSTDSDPVFYGLGLIQNVEAAAMDVFISGRQYDLDGADKITTVMGGIRIRF
jgi:predicted porin